MRSCLGLERIFNPKSSLRVTLEGWSKRPCPLSHLFFFFFFPPKVSKVFSNRRRLQHTSAPNDSLGKYNKFTFQLMTDHLKAQFLILKKLELTLWLETGHLLWSVAWE
jgi:hypothetical protein